MAVVFSNNATTALASSVTNSATSLTVQDGSVFPTLSGADYTYITLEGLDGNVEIVKLTARSGNTLTVARAQDGTSARAFSSGSKCELRLTAALLNEVATQADTDTNTTYTAGSGLSLTGTEFANTAPDQTVALTGAGATSISGTYPNFTITSTDTGTVYTHPSAHSISFITGLQTALDGKVDDSQVLTNVPSGALFTDTDTVYTHPSAHSISFITGLQTALDGKVDDSQVLTNVPANALFTDTVYTLPAGYATETYVGTAISNLVDSSPTALDTLNELAAALGDDPNFATTVNSNIASKLPLAGGTLTGDLKVSKSDAAIYLNDSSGTPNQQGMRIRAESIDSNLPNNEGIGIIFEEDPANGSPDTTPAVITTGEFYAQSDKKVWHDGTLTTTNKSNYDTAYGWGNHATAGYTSNVGDITGVTAGTGLTGGGTSGTPTLNVIGGSGITANANDIAVDSTVLRTTGTQTVGGSKTFTAGLAISTGQKLTLRDSNHFVQFLSTGYSGSTIDGPIVNGHQGGELTTNLGGNNYSLRWNNSGNVYIRTGLQISGNTAWHAGNDGSGSGLDADLLDGQHGSYYYSAANPPPTYSKYLRSDTDDTTTGSLTISGSQSRGTYASASNYHSGADNLVLKGNSSGISSIFFESEKDGTNINHPSDFGFIQFHSYGTGTSGESNELIIGVSNDSDDHVILNAPNANGLKYRIGSSATDYTVWHSGNDGASSGLDADLLDGQHGSYYYAASNPNGYTNDQTAAEILTAIKTVDGSGSGLDADLLDGQQASAFLGVSATASKANKLAAGGTGPNTENLNTVADSVSTGQLEYRGFNASSSNAPPVSDNANGVISVGQHSGNYGAQVAFSSNGNMYWRDNPGSGFGSWRKMYDSGNDGSGSGLDADLLDGQHGSHYLNYNNLTNKPSIPPQSVTPTVSVGANGSDVTITNYSSYINPIILGTVGGVASVWNEVSAGVFRSPSGSIGSTTFKAREAGLSESNASSAVNITRTTRHRYWRLTNFTGGTSQTNSGNFIRHINFYSDSAGTIKSANYSTRTASHFYSTTYQPSKTETANGSGWWSLGTLEANRSGTGTWLKLDNGSVPTVDAVCIRLDCNMSYMATACDLQWSDDNSNWITWMNISGSDISDNNLVINL